MSSGPDLLIEHAKRLRLTGEGGASASLADYFAGRKVIDFAAARHRLHSPAVGVKSEQTHGC
jgi:hypothetical protein